MSPVSLSPLNQEGLKKLFQLFHVLDGSADD